MQAIWSRVGQAHHCGCRACAQAANALTRRSTASVGRRKPTFGEVFTACYTSIMGTAAVLDAKRKDERRKDLDRQLQQAKADLDELRETSSEFDAEMEAALLGMQNSRQADRIPLRTKSPPKAPRSQPPLPSLRQSPAAKHHEYLDIRETLLSYIDRAQPVVDSRQNPRNSLSASVRNWYARQSQAKGAQFQTISRRARTELYDRLEADNLHQADWEALRLSAHDNATRSFTKERRLAHLIDQLLSMVGYVATGPEIPGAFDKLRLLADADEPLPCFDPFIEGQQELRRVHAQLRRHFASSDNASEPQRLVADVCHSLLLLKTPPTTETFNILILGFGRLGYPRFSGAVMRICHWSGVWFNNQSIVCAIQFGIESNSLAAFHSSVEQALGMSLSGRRLARRLGISYDDSKECRSWGLKARIHLTSDVLDAILRGLTHFNFLPQAISVLLHALRHQIKVYAHTVHSLLDKCRLELQYSASSLLVEKLSGDVRMAQFLATACDRTKLADQLLALAVVPHTYFDIFALLEEPSGLYQHEDLPPYFWPEQTKRLLRNLAVSPEQYYAQYTQTLPFLDLRLRADSAIALAEKTVGIAHLLICRILEPVALCKASHRRLQKWNLQMLLDARKTLQAKAKLIATRLEEEVLVRQSRRWAGPDTSGRWLVTASYRHGIDSDKGWTADITIETTEGPKEKRIRIAERSVTERSTVVDEWPESSLPGLQVAI